MAIRAVLASATSASLAADPVPHPTEIKSSKVTSAAMCARTPSLISRILHWKQKKSWRDTETAGSHRMQITPYLHPKVKLDS